MSPIVAGVDVGSLSTDVVILKDRQIIASIVDYTGVNGSKTARRLFQECLDKLAMKENDVRFIVSTGYGRERVDFANARVTEISCHAKGANYFFPQARTIIDIGGQDSKVIKVNEKGEVLKFAMNDKCAAGTGRFLEIMARALEIELEELADYSTKAYKKLAISSMCTVFAESEVISLLAQGNCRENIIAGLHQSIVQRLVGLVARVGLEEVVVMTGGVAKNKGIVQELCEQMRKEIVLPPEPQIIGALGAARFALSKLSSGNAS
ncbi:MAG: acyl-CoA dehydratase activase [Bacillota bacterium]